MTNWLNAPRPTQWEQTLKRKAQFCSQNKHSKQNGHAGGAHGHAHAHHGHSHELPNSVSAVAWMVIMGDGLHNFCDGLALGESAARFSAVISGPSWCSAGTLERQQTCFHIHVQSWTGPKKFQGKSYFRS